LNKKILYNLYENLSPIEISLSDETYNLIILNKIRFLLYVMLKRLPFELVLVLIKNIIINYSFKFDVYIILKEEVIIHYTVIQKRKYQVKMNYNSNVFEIGPSYTKREYRNKGHYTRLINTILKNEGKNKSFYSLIRTNNKESNKIFSKFSDNIKKVIKEKKIVSFYRIEN